ncbi:MAG: DMT family transporter [archaeon]
MAVLQGVLFGFLALILWGGADILTRILINKISKRKMLFFAQLFSGLSILIIALILGEIKSLLVFAVVYLIILSLVNLVGTLTMYKAIQNKGLALSTPIVNAYAFITVILGIIFYGESVTFLQVFAIAMIIGGILVLSMKKGVKIHFDSSFIFAFFSMLMWGFFFFMIKVPTLIFGAVFTILMIKAFTTLFTFPISLEKKVRLFDTKPKYLLLVILMGILEGFAFMAFSYGVAIAPVSIVTPISSAVPVLSVFSGVLLFKEKLTRKQVFGIAIAILGMIVIAL